MRIKTQKARQEQAGLTHDISNFVNVVEWNFRPGDVIVVWHDHLYDYLLTNKDSQNGQIRAPYPSSHRDQVRCLITDSERAGENEYQDRRQFVRLRACWPYKDGEKYSESFEVEIRDIASMFVRFESKSTGEMPVAEEAVTAEYHDECWHLESVLRDRTIGVFHSELNGVSDETQTMFARFFASAPDMMRLLLSAPTEDTPDFDARYAEWCKAKQTLRF